MVEGSEKRKRNPENETSGLFLQNICEDTQHDLMINSQPELFEKKKSSQELTSI